MDRRFARELRGTYRPIPRALAGIAIGAIALAVSWVMRTPRSPCDQEARHGDRDRAVVLCLASYAVTSDPHDLVSAAMTSARLGWLDRAEDLASQALAGSLDGEARGILSYVALRRGVDATATMHAALGLVADAASGDLLGQARDLTLLSLADLHAGDFAAALDGADQALAILARSPDLHAEGRARIARADTLRRIGDLDGALAELSLAVDRTDEICDRAWIDLKLGLTRMEAQQDPEAMIDLDAADDANQRGRCGYADISHSVALNQAWLQRATDPAAALAKLDELERSGDSSAEVLLLRGYLAADRGALGDAAQYLELAALSPPSDADWPWEIERARGELSELRGGMLGDMLAEASYRRTTAMVAALRGSARARSASFVAGHRAPYDDLIALLARQGRWRDVLSVVLELDASDMLRATADRRTRHDAPAPAPGAAASIARRVPAVDDVVAAWRDRDLVIVIAPTSRRIGSGRERMYRVRIAKGQLSGEDVGDAATARDRAQRLFDDPGDRGAARELGRRIVPADAASGTLDVLAIGALGKVPLPALRDPDGALVVARRPLARVLAIEASGPEAAGAGAPVVIADPLGDLPSGAAEGAMLAKLLGPRAQLSGAGLAARATRARLWQARDAGLLHVASHVGTHGRWRALRLFDGEVDPDEVVQRGLAPRIAVIAGCGSAAATDEEGWGSIAAALLEAGTAVVIATDRTVGDEASLAVMRAFYAQPDWRAAPERALASVQRALDARDGQGDGQGDDAAARPRSWAAFAVLRRPPWVVARP